MKKAIFIVAAMLACNVIMAQSPMQVQLQAPEQDYIEVSARASREVTPDEIFVAIILDQNDTKGKYTIDQLETQLYKALKSAGVDADKELRVSDLSSDYKSFLLKKNEGRVTKNYLLKVDNDHLMPVFRELDKAGISNVSVQSVRYSKMKEVYGELIGEAVALAKSRATIMAGAVGQSIKNMIFAQTYDNSAAYDQASSANSMMLAKASRDYFAEQPAPTFEFTKIRIEANVTARFGLYN